MTTRPDTTRPDPLTAGLHHGPYCVNACVCGIKVLRAELEQLRTALAEAQAGRDATQEQLRLTHIDWQLEMQRAEDAEAEVARLTAALEKIRGIPQCSYSLEDAQAWARAVLLPNKEGEGKGG